MTTLQHIYEVRSRKDRRGACGIDEPSAISNANGYDISNSGHGQKSVDTTYTLHREVV
jgi:hypothetical protein